MSVVISSNNRKHRDTRAPAPAVHQDGSNFEWRMFFDDNQRIADSDTTTELLDILVPNYVGMDSNEKRNARHVLAREVQILARALSLASVDASVVEDWEWEVLTYGEGENQDPYGWGDGSGVIGVSDEDVIDLWSNDVPLILLDTSYYPYTSVPAPLSSEGDYIDVKNIVWLRPDNELGLLRSLSRIGYITFGKPTATYNGE